MNKEEIWLDALDDACCRVGIPMPEKATELAAALAENAECMGEHEFHDKPSAIPEVNNQAQLIDSLKRQLRIEVSRRTGVPVERLKFADNGQIYHNAYYPHEGV